VEGVDRSTNEFIVAYILQSFLSVELLISDPLVAFYDIFRKTLNEKCNFFNSTILNIRTEHEITGEIPCMVNST
jgi:hypothetical protein